MLAGLGVVDGIALVILSLAVVRGLFRGLIGEAFSLGALGGACIAVRYGTDPVAAWLEDVTVGGIGATAAPWVAGLALGIGTIAVVAAAGRLVKRGATAAGLGWADRLGGGALGAAEGALAVALGLLVATWLLGRDHPALEHSRSMETFARLQRAIAERGGELPDVAAPPGRS